MAADQDDVPTTGTSERKSWGTSFRNDGIGGPVRHSLPVSKTRLLSLHKAIWTKDHPKVSRIINNEPQYYRHLGKSQLSRLPQADRRLYLQKCLFQEYGRGRSGALEDACKRNSAGDILFLIENQKMWPDEAAGLSCTVATCAASLARPDILDMVASKAPSGSEMARQLYEAIAQAVRKRNEAAAVSLLELYSNIFGSAPPASSYLSSYYYEVTNFFIARNPGGVHWSAATDRQPVWYYLMKSCNTVERMRFFLTTARENGLEIDFDTQYNGMTAVMYSMQNAKPWQLDVIMNQQHYPRPDIDAANPAGFTSLHRAVRDGKSDGVRRLLDHGADPSHRSFSGKTALDLAVHHRRGRTFDMMQTLAGISAGDALMMYGSLLDGLDSSSDGPGSSGNSGGDSNNGSSDGGGGGGGGGDGGGGGGCGGD